MPLTSSNAAIAALITLPLISSAPSAFAQDAIMLESIGAVRMVTPAEAQRLDAERHPAAAARQAGKASANKFAPVKAFGIPAVIGLAYHDPRVATDASEVRRQGGFATAGTVRWLPAAPAASVEAKAETTKVGTL